MQNNNIQTSFPPFKSLSKGGNAKSGGLEVDSSRPPLHDGPEQAGGDDTLMQRIKPYLDGCPIAVCFLLIRKP